jgi:hypothetical protein
MGLIDDEAVVACNGVTECDQANSAAATIPIPIVPVENNSLRMMASFLSVNAVIMTQSCFRTLPLPSQNDVVKDRLFRGDRNLMAQVS